MFSKLTRKVKITIIAFVAVGLIILGLVGWAKWSMSMVDDLHKAKTTIQLLQEKIENLTLIDDQEEKIEQSFDQISQDQIDLLCAARYNAPVEIVEKPILKEVIVYRDRRTNCPTLIVEDAEPITPGYQELRPVNEQIAIQSLDNSWKAFCVATDYKDPLCRPQLTP